MGNREIVVRPQTVAPANDWRPLSEVVKIKPRLIMSTQAYAKSGKSFLGLTAPRPLGIMNLDDGIERAVKGHAKSLDMSLENYLAADGPGGRIYAVDYTREILSLKENGGNSKYVMEVAARQLARMQTNYIEGLQDARTLMVDGAQELWELVRLAFFGKVDYGKQKGEYQFDYGVLNRVMKLWILLAKQSDCNVIFTHRVKDEYIGKDKSGKLEMDGWKYMPYEVDTVVEQRYEEKQDFPDCFHVKILQCGMNPLVNRLDCFGLDAAFPNIAHQIYPEFDETYWR
jgi:hypothetical protein